MAVILPPWPGCREVAAISAKLAKLGGTSSASAKGHVQPKTPRKVTKKQVAFAAKPAADAPAGVEAALLWKVVARLVDETKDCAESPTDNEVAEQLRQLIKPG